LQKGKSLMDKKTYKIRNHKNEGRPETIGKEIASVSSREIDKKSEVP